MLPTSVYQGGEMSNIDILKCKIQDFVRERDWEKYHSPKNIAMALSVEAAELLEIFLWLSQDESKHLDEKQLSKVKEEIGDIMIYLINLADKYSLDPINCATEKIELNEEKYPSHLVKGSAKKYDEYC